MEFLGLIVTKFNIKSKIYTSISVVNRLNNGVYSQRLLLPLNKGNAKMT